MGWCHPAQGRHSPLRSADPHTDVLWKHPHRYSQKSALPFLCALVSGEKDGREDILPRSKTNSYPLFSHVDWIVSLCVLGCEELFMGHLSAIRLTNVCELTWALLLVIHL